MSKKIEKPWAVYCLSPRIIKIATDSQDGVTILDSENQEYFPLIFLSKNPHNLKRFETSYEAISYFRSTYLLNKEKIIQDFLERFPSERKNIESALAQASAQTLAKCTIYPRPEKSHGWMGLREIDSDPAFHPSAN